MKPQLPSTPTRDADKISCGWIRQLLECVKYAMDTPRGDGKTILRSGAILHAVRTGGGSAGGEAGDTYCGPFSIVKKNATTLTVKAYDGETYLSRNYIIAGTSRTEVATDQDITISVSGSVYAQITQSGGVYAVAFNNAITLPAQSNTVYYVELCSVLFESGAIAAVNRSRYGHIEVTGRFVS